MKMCRLWLYCLVPLLWVSSGFHSALADVVIQPPSDNTSIRGAPSDYGVGVTVGTVLGLSGAWRPSTDSVWWTQAELGGSGVNGSLHIAADYLVKVQEIPTPHSSTFRLDVAVGGGLRLQTDSDNILGVRVPVGVALVPKDVRVDAFVQLVPTLVLVSSAAVRVDANMGARFYF
ncbi:MAG: hypothetical protein CL930_10265 [Deltaproteobacteria bacterium]|nr:hypothetical protein [Deltaproteobacteria bacterium]